MCQVFGPDYESRLERSLVEVIQGQCDRGVVVCAEGKRVGVIMLRTAPNTGLLHALGVVEAYRMKGIADQLINAAIDLALSEAPDLMIFAAVEEDSVWDRERYERRGFKLVHRDDKLVHGDDKLEGHFLLKHEGVPAATIEAA